ncbi:MAG: hypothetical protein EZS28_022247 [Streblomastix strix]|uniref:Uncharacterized protein n=1 Tax=Streblomastix strix TaxID=222440 RepID=A0A5J4VI16_9EUKA|nr:MAG: hypothetical protein EZS28_022247 [Streblomastix strix]
MVLFFAGITEGIVRIEIIFDNTRVYIKSIGIADASCSFAAGKEPWELNKRLLDIGVMAETLTTTAYQTYGEYEPINPPVIKYHIRHLRFN